MLDCGQPHPCQVARARVECGGLESSEGQADRCLISSVLLQREEQVRSSTGNLEERGRAAHAVDQQQRSWPGLVTSSVICTVTGRQGNPVNGRARLRRQREDRGDDTLTRRSGVCAPLSKQKVEGERESGR